jgi:arabinose-5-phosphate isomerase
MLSFAKQILNQEAQVLQELAARLDERFGQAVQFVLRCQGSIIVCGIGKAGLVGQKLTATFSSTGTPSHFLHPAEAIHGDLGRIGKNDAVLMLSQSGETEEITRLLPSIKQFGVPLLAITATETNTLARNADIVLPLGKFGEADPLGLAPTTSTTAMMALGDALALVVSQRRKFRAEDFAAFHPGGALGRKLCLVEDQMRTLDRCRVAPDTETIREVFVRHSVPGRRSGAILLTNHDGKLSGIFTDSDLARLFEKRNDKMLDRPICEVMTSQLASVHIGSKMLEAIAVMGEKHISELPVIDDEHRPVEMIDITDVVAVFPEYTLEHTISATEDRPILRIA